MIDAKLQDGLHLVDHRLWIAHPQFAAAVEWLTAEGAQVWTATRQRHVPHGNHALVGHFEAVEQRIELTAIGEWQRIEVFDERSRLVPDQPFAVAPHQTTNLREV